MRVTALVAVIATLSACTGAPAPAPTPAETTPEAAGHDHTHTEAKTDTPAASTAATVGEKAPDFTLTDLDGTEHTLSAYAGKTVVLEWFNPGCPFVVAAHGEGPLKDMAKTYMDKGVVWLSINSGAPGKEGHGAEVNKKAVADWAMPNPVLVDEAGTVGRQYGAKTTPHMYVIDPQGTLVYAGGLDNAPRNEQPAAGYVPFTAQAIDAVLAGEPVATSKTQAWGCSVKYGS